MPKLDAKRIAAAIAATEELIEGSDPGGFGQSTLRLLVNQLGAELGTAHPRFNAAAFESDALPRQSARMAAAIVRTLGLEREPEPEPAPELHPDYLHRRGIPFGACECEGAVQVVSGGARADYLCARCDRPVVYLWAFENGGEWHHAAPTGVLELGDEIGAGQCSSCGSFDPQTGEPGRGFVLEQRGRRVAAVCPCCGDERRLELRAHPEVIL
jgi:hypothetical protein